MSVEHKRPREVLAEAEPLVFAGYEGLKQRKERFPVNDKARLKQTLQRLLELYGATGWSDRTAEWKRKLAELEKAESENPPSANAEAVQL